MASHEIESQWMGKMQFNTLINGHTVIMDAPERAGGEDNGPIPKPFLLSALAGCTGMDVIALLRKSGSLPDQLDLKVEGQLSRQSPITYTSIHVSYIITGSPELKEAVIKAINYSQDELCGVSFLLKKAVPVTWSISFNSDEVYSNREVGVHAG